MKKKGYIIALLALILVIVVIFAVYRTATNNDSSTKENQSTSEEKQTSPDSVESKQANVATEEVTEAKDLFDAYKNDPAKKEATYNGESIIVHGVITYIGRDSHGTPSINLSDKAGGEGYVLCVFGSFDELDAFSLGQEVTISANFHIMGSDGMVVLKESKVV